MGNSITPYFGASVAVHLFVLLSGTLFFSKPSYIVVPVEINLLGSSAPAPSVTEMGAARAERVIRDDKDDDVIVKKKEKDKKKRIESTQSKVTSKEDQKIVSAEEPKADASLQPGEGAADGLNAATSKSPVSFDTTNFPFAYYTGSIVKKIGKSWTWSNRFGDRKAIVYFKILRSGTIAEARIATSSGDSLFDQQAIRAIYRSNPFPALPDGYKDQDLGVYFEFSYAE